MRLLSYMVLDTPGQIEIFTWSASGAIITDAVAVTFPTVVAYVIDTGIDIGHPEFQGRAVWGYNAVKGSGPQC